MSSQVVSNFNPEKREFIGTENTTRDPDYINTIIIIILPLKLILPENCLSSAFFKCLKVACPEQKKEL